MTSNPLPTRRETLRLLGLSAASLACASCASNPFFPTETKPPEASELLTFHPARKSRAEVVKLAEGDHRQVVLKHHYLKLVAGRRGSDYVVGEKFTFAPREADGGISVCELSDKKYAALVRDPRMKNEGIPTLVTMLGFPAYVNMSGQWSPDIPTMAMTPSLLSDDKIRVASMSSGGAVLTKPFELDLDRDRWYAILLDVARSPDGSAAREHLCCLRIELPQDEPAAK